MKNKALYIVVAMSLLMATTIFSLAYMRISEKSVKSQITWHPCLSDLSLYCADIVTGKNQVPSTIRNSHIALSTTNPSSLRSPDHLFIFNPGGPGLSAQPTLKLLLARFPELSQPGNLLIGVEPQSLEIPDEKNCLSTPHTHSCTAYFASLKKVSTRSEVDVLDYVRREINPHSFTIIGFSYGSVVAEQFAREHPSKISSIILDGAIFDQNINKSSALPATARISDGTTAGYLLNKDISNECIKHKCSLLGTQIQWMKILEELHKKPITVGGAHLTYQSVSSAMLNNIENIPNFSPAEDIAALFSTIIRKETPDGAIVNYLQDSDVTTRSSLSAAWTLCADSSTNDTPMNSTQIDQWAAVNFRKTMGFSFLFSQDSKSCRDTQPNYSSLYKKGFPRIPVLLYSAQLDPVTPAFHSSQLWAEVDRGIEVLTSGSQHLSASRGDCAQKIFKEFIHSSPQRKSVVRCP